MRKIIVCEWLSLDGFFSGINGETDWFYWDKEIESYFKNFQQSIDTLLFGRVTYDIMKAYWPTDAAASEDQGITSHLNDSKKIVYSKAGADADWNNTVIKQEIIPTEIMALKQEAGKDIVIYGSGSIVSQLTGLGMIDEYLLAINPVILGKGNHLFQQQEKPLHWQLIETRSFTNGLIILRYKP